MINEMSMFLMIAFKKKKNKQQTENKYNDSYTHSRTHTQQKTEQIIKLSKKKLKFL